METTAKTGRSQVGGSRYNTRPHSSMKYASTHGRRHLPSGMAKSEKSVVSTKQYQIFNELNVDVTPLPLLDSISSKRVNIITSKADGQISEFPSVIGMTGTSSFTGGPFSRSVFNTAVNDTVSEEFADTDVNTSWKLTEPQVDVEEVLTEKDLQAFVTIDLEETDTDIVFELFNTCIMAGTPEEEIVTKRNQQYKILVNSRDGNDRYISKEMNTFNNQLKTKSVQTTPINYQNTGVMASNWDMHDSYEILRKTGFSAETELTEEDFLEKTSDTKVNLDSDGVQDKAKSDGETMYLSTASSRISQNLLVNLNDTSTEEQMKNAEKVLQNANFKNDLFIMERIVNLNSYQNKLADYRDLPIISLVPESDVISTQAKDSALSTPSLFKLWSFACPLTKGRTINCMAWNPKNPNLIAVGYGQLKYKNQKSGLACCWSLKNPEFPERMFHTEHGVTAVSFSNTNSNLLAVGLYNGSLVIYDMVTNSNEPALHNFQCPSKHTGPIGQVRWIEKEASSSDDSENTEFLISISKDGRVTSWLIQKGFESNDLMRLRRTVTNAKIVGKNREKKVEMFISRYDGGMCLDFHPTMPNIYLVGTEEAFIHKCSCSYNEQYLETYVGHLAPVYCVTWSPFLPDVFLSCGADWTVRIWHQDRLTPILTFSSSVVLDSKFDANRTQKSFQLSRTGDKTVYRLKNVFAVDWSPRSSTIFACVNEEGVEVWDLSKNILDPIINYPPKGAPRGPTPTQITFAKNSDCVYVGDDEGSVVVLQLQALPTPPDPDKQKQTLIEILDSSLANQLKDKDEKSNLFKSSLDTDT